MADKAEKWLRQNDPHYDVKHLLEYPYCSDRLMRKKAEKEIPIDPSKIMYLAEGRRIIN